MIEEISGKQGLESVLTALLSDRLAVLAGAGLSMAPPSRLPSAAELAKRAKCLYDGTYGATCDPLPTTIEEQAEFFLARGELATVYLRTYIDFDAFASQPNEGHYAVADLLLIGAIQCGVTTNVDDLVETAGKMLCGQIGAAVDAHSLAALPIDTRPLLKIHGCWSHDRGTTIWSKGQLETREINARVARNAEWMSVHLADRDLLIVGYWTDWDYLNEVLAKTLGAINPARVIIVDLQDGASFETKAPALFALGNRAAVAFKHVRASGADFLAALRKEFSKTFIRRILKGGADEFAVATGAAMPPALEPPDLDNKSLWEMRRDLEGRTQFEHCKERHPTAGPLLGLTLLQLRARGAQADSSLWVLNDKRIRVLRAEGKALHAVKAAFEGEVAPIVAPDIVIAVGAEALNLPANIARPTTEATITRGTASHWMTRTEAVQELDLNP